MPEMDTIAPRNTASCPSSNGTTYASDDGSLYELYCDFNFDGYDLPATPATSFSDCINSCSSYVMAETALNGANCVAAVFGAADPNGNPCWLKSQIQNVVANGYMIYAARRIEYQIGSSPVYTSFQASASSFTQSVAAASTSHSPELQPTTVVVVETQAIGDENTSSISADKSPSTIVSTLIIVSSEEPAPQSTGVFPPFSRATSTPTAASSMPVQSSGANSYSSAFSGSSADATPSINSNTVSSSQGSLAINSASPSATQSPSSDSNSLSLGAKVGIGVGAGVLGIFVLALLVFVLGYRRRKRSQVPTEARVQTSPRNKSSIEELGDDSPSKPGWRAAQELQGDSPPVSELDTRLGDFPSSSPSEAGFISTRITKGPKV